MGNSNSNDSDIAGVSENTEETINNDIKCIGSTKTTSPSEFISPPEVIGATGATGPSVPPEFISTLEFISSTGATGPTGPPEIIGATGATGPTEDINSIKNFSLLFHTGNYLSNIDKEIKIQQDNDYSDSLDFFMKTFE